MYTASGLAPTLPRLSLLHSCKFEKGEGRGGEERGGEGKGRRGGGEGEDRGVGAGLKWLCTALRRGPLIEHNSSAYQLKNRLTLDCCTDQLLQATERMF